MISWHSGRLSAARQRSRYRWRSMKVVRRKPWPAMRLMKGRVPVSTEAPGGGIGFDGALGLPEVGAGLGALTAKFFGQGAEPDDGEGHGEFTLQGVDAVS